MSEELPERVERAEARVRALGRLLGRIGAKVSGAAFGFGPWVRVVFSWRSGQAPGGGTSLWPSPEAGDADEARVTTLPVLLDRLGLAEEAEACRYALAVETEGEGPGRG